MEILTYILVYAGAALMVYNIIRYGMFVKSSAGLEKQNRRTGLLIIPLLLLIFFLVGYLVVGITGLAELSLIIPLILFGGSVFVFMLLTVMFTIISHIRETDRILSLRYDEMREQVGSLAKEAMAVFLVNLTKDVIVERSGEYLYDSDIEQESYSGLLEARSPNVIDPSYSGPDMSAFRREELLKSFRAGHMSVSEVVLAKRKDGSSSFVILEASFTKMPVSDDIVALITERQYNEEIVKKTLLEKVMLDEYDRISYIINGHYRVLFSNDGKKDRLLFPADPEGEYENLYFNYVLPTMIWKSESGPNPMRLSRVDAELEKNDFYEVVSLFDIDGEIRRKCIRYYTVDRGAKFYIMLISDVTRHGDVDVDAETEKEEAPADPVPEMPAPSEAATVAEEEKTDARPLRVLLVEDNPINIDMAEMILSSEGWEVTKATNGAEAVEAVSSAEPGTFDIVLMDVNMPVMNGYEATAAIRALPDGSKASIPILAVSANSFEEDRKAALDAGMNDHISKPINTDEVRAAAETLVPGFASRE